ncbi:hypothetical protein FNF29_03949 [Cafeteria roenbergensis]|uniref:Uncharacterized protein n=1 Tax=Cafeteria roenbergensis TaxID=33653 RepID=A0A5A8CH57_CAFRO|nr:hypothetical protein FNF29_03949 [Cafeteria roenbergensis]|eukprot:KAA0152383.1 hypothetical protein FNF29_03949 [Cafeteria roenbergensis]
MSDEKRAPFCSYATLESLFVWSRRWLIGDRTTLTDHVQLYLILGLVTANLDFSIPIMYMALGPLVQTPDDVFDLFDTRFYFVSQTLLFMPIICGYLTDYLGRYSHIVMIVCCLGLSSLQVLALVPWGDIFTDETCGVRGPDDEIIFCSAHAILLTVFLVRGVFLNQALDQMLKMLSVRASKQFPHDEERKEIEIQRTGTMSDAMTSVIEGVVFGIAILMTDYGQMRMFLTATGIGSTLVVAALCLGYTARSFTISRKEQQHIPVEGIAAKFTDDAESIAASSAEDHTLGLLSDSPKRGRGGYGTSGGDAFSPSAGPSSGGGVVEGLAQLDDRPSSRRRSSSGDGSVADFKPVRPGDTAAAAAATAAAASPGAAGGRRRSSGSSSDGGTSRPRSVHVAGAESDSNQVICGQCLCFGIQCTGCQCGSRKSAWGQFLSWLSGLLYFAVTPVICLPFIAYLFVQLFNIIVTYPVPQQEAAHFNLADDLADDGGNMADDLFDDDALGPPGVPPGSFMFRLARVISTVNSQFASQSAIYLGGSAAYAAFVAEMRPFIFFRIAFPISCAVVAALMVLYYVPSRPEEASTTIVGLTQVISYFAAEFLQWFLMAVVPESLFGLFTIAQGVGMASMGVVGSQLVRWNPVEVIVFSQILLGCAAFFSIVASVVAYNRLLKVEEEEEDDGSDDELEDSGKEAGSKLRAGSSSAGPASDKHAKEKGHIQHRPSENEVMRTARLGGYAGPGKPRVSEAPERHAGAPDDLFGDALEGSAVGPRAASLSGYHHTDRE